MLCCQGKHLVAHRQDIDELVVTQANHLVTAAQLADFSLVMPFVFTGALPGIPVSTSVGMLPASK